MVPLLIAGGAISVFGQLQQGSFAKKMGKIADQELGQQADMVLRQRSLDVQYLNETQRARRGGQIASFARGGVDVNAGSAFEFNLAQTRFDSITKSRMLFEAQLQARQLRFQGEQARAAGKQAQTQSILSAFGTVANTMALSASVGSAPTVNPVTGGVQGAAR